jgi:hypothetical protein
VLGAGAPVIFPRPSSSPHRSPETVSMNARTLLVVSLLHLPALFHLPKPLSAQPADNEAVMRERRVPREVRLRMGFTPSSGKK